MKRLNLFFFMMFGLIGLISSATITVSSPSDVSEWVKGKNYPILWTSSGNPSSHVDIILFDGTVSNKIMDIDLNTPNDGRYEWDLPLFIKPGNHVIRIKARGNPTFGDSPIFNIYDPPSGEMIRVQSPHDGVAWEKGGSYRIIWYASETLPPQVDISLFDETGNRKISPVGVNVPNNGNFLWTVPRSVPSGRYVIGVQSKGHPVSDNSAVFSISDKKSPMMKHLLSPRHRSRWQRGKIMPVRWNLSEGRNRKRMARGQEREAPSQMNETVRIQYIKVKGVTQRKPLAGKWFPIHMSAPNTGHFPWMIPETMEKGFYVIRITEMHSPPNKPGATLSQSESDIFEIY